MGKPILEAWSLPGVGAFERKVAAIPYETLSYDSNFNRVGRGTFSVPMDYSRLDEILDPDNNLETLIRVFEDGVNTASFYARSYDKSYKVNGKVRIAGPGIADALDKTKFYPRDWAGSDIIPASSTTGVSLISDLVYGGDSILSNGGFEQGLLNEKQQIQHDYRPTTDLDGAITDTDGSLTLTDGSGFPASDFRLVIGSERIHVTTRTGNVCSGLGRGYAGTTASGHADAAPVEGNGSFSLTYSGQTTVQIDWDGVQKDGTDDLERALEDLSNIIDVGVQGSGTPADPWLIEFIDPGEIDNPMLTWTNFNMTSGTSFAISEYQLGGKGDPAPWTKSYNPNTQQYHGGYDTFSVGSNSKFGDPAHSGDKALGIDPDLAANPVDNYPGAQQIISVTQGEIYQASAWVYCNNPGMTMALVVRDLYENEIAKTTIQPSATTWTQISIPNVPIQNNRRQAIFRVAAITPGETDIFWIDDCEFNEGLAPEKAGQIVQNLWTYSIAEGRNSLSWLKRDSFNGTTDSDSVAWVEDISMTVVRGWSWLQVLEALARQGIEWKIEWNSGSNQYELLLYENGSMGAAKTGNNDVRLSTISLLDGTVRKSSPEHNAMLGEGAGGVVSEVTDATLISAYGRREDYIGDSDLNDAATLDSALNHALDVRRAQKNGGSFEVDPSVTFGPGLDLDVGDTVNVFLPGDINGPYRIHRWSVTVNQAGHVMKQVEVGKFVPIEVLGGTTSSATSSAVNYLLKQFRKLDRVTGAVADLANVVPAQISAVETPVGGFTLRIAAFDATDISKAGANYVCDGVDDQVEIQAALDAVSVTRGGRILLSEGTFYVKQQNPNSSSFLEASTDNTQLIGMGREQTYLYMSSVPVGPCDKYWGSNGFQTEMRDFSWIANAGQNWDMYGIHISGSYSVIENVYINGFGGIGLYAGGYQTRVDKVHVESIYSEYSPHSSIGIQVNGRDATVTNSVVDFCSGVGIHVEDLATANVGYQITNNYIWGCDLYALICTSYGYRSLQITAEGQAGHTGGGPGGDEIPEHTGNADSWAWPSNGSAVPDLYAKRRFVAWTDGVTPPANPPYKITRLTAPTDGGKRGIECFQGNHTDSLGVDLYFTNPKNPFQALDVASTGNDLANRSDRRVSGWVIHRPPDFDLNVLHYLNYLVDSISGSQGWRVTLEVEWFDQAGASLGTSVTTHTPTVAGLWYPVQLVANSPSVNSHYYLCKVTVTDPGATESGNFYISDPVSSVAGNEAYPRAGTIIANNRFSDNGFGQAHSRGYFATIVVEGFVPTVVEGNTSFRAAGPFLEWSQIAGYGLNPGSLIVSNNHVSEYQGEEYLASGVVLQPNRNSADYPGGVIIKGNQFASHGYSVGVLTLDKYQDVLIEGNLFAGTIIAARGGRNFKIVNNLFNGRGFQLNGGSFAGYRSLLVVDRHELPPAIEGNQFMASDHPTTGDPQYLIEVKDTDGAIVRNNVYVGTDQYDGYGGSTPVDRGLRIDANCDATIYVGNDFSRVGVTKYDDAGTNTVNTYPNDVTIGDNW